MNSIEAYNKGSIVKLIEKRSNYYRNTWFDVEPKPWSIAKETLLSWGIQYQIIEHIVHDGVPDIITIRTQNLER